MFCGLRRAMCVIVIRRGVILKLRNLLLDMEFARSCYVGATLVSRNDGIVSVGPPGSASEFALPFRRRYITHDPDRQG
jgi:hypothetical protein